MFIVKNEASQQRLGILAHVMEWGQILRQALDHAEVARSNPYEAARIGRAQLDQGNVARNTAQARASRIVPLPHPERGAFSGQPLPYLR